MNRQPATAETKRVCTREAATRSPSLPSVVVYLILEALRDGKSVTAFLSALPPLTLPPELIALRDLGAVVNLACHWPVVHITKIPIQYARLGVAALPVFAGVYIDAGFTALDWLDATPQKAVTLVVDPSVPGTLTTFAYNWGDGITAVVIKGHKVAPDPIPDMLGRCVNVQSASIEGAATQAAAAAYLAALSTQHLRTLKVTANGTGPTPCDVPPPRLRLCDRSDSAGQRNPSVRYALDIASGRRRGRASSLGDRRWHF
ncbi:hypothetical protein SPRG_09708 [Saprolegnia parasitica CBS 223.65]|uniref:Uncharacterized protein n=1 Tax=Saprolegnia parasitica (strain CBS 223.65) TaxID=695850 RepID=A0A067C2G0_SAPPC|nr:hypothetical protein SPRG_09708 [Saprolegnia parasitica CBS 223.65]KDO24979.1 hypothetical protein SPRG_09708 [Saprolegnia parasitica CBS 223.65]|eukprot:XP_012204248.1 hypothetical protein SPRG_09708 [Saprolegnia parasitica CBS 223.65]